MFFQICNNFISSDEKLSGFSSLKLLSFKVGIGNAFLSIFLFIVYGILSKCTM